MLNVGQSPWSMATGQTKPFDPGAASFEDQLDQQGSLYDTLVSASKARMLAQLGNDDSPGAKVLREMLDKLSSTTTSAAPPSPTSPDVDEIYKTAKLRSMADGNGLGDMMLKAMNEQDDRARKREHTSPMLPW